MNHESTGTLPGLAQAWAAVGSQGYALTSDRAIGLPEDFRENFRDTYFNSDVLHHDEGDWPVDRERARDVIRYWWLDDKLRLEEHKNITITDRAEIPGPREHSRVMLLHDSRGEEVLRALLALVPPGQRQSNGTFGVNLFRTFTNVVSKLHRDDEEFVITYVLDRVGSGAETQIYERRDVSDDGKPTAGAKPVLQRQLNPGDIIIFDDDRFRHGATPLEAQPGETTRRDALVCTVDYRKTYLAATA